MVRPWPSRIGSGMPQNLGDSVLITWILHWGVHALTTNPQSYFHGNIFWPNANTLAYSDLLAPFVPVYGLFFGLSRDWPLALNLTILVMFGLSLVATYLLGRRLIGSTPGAVLAAFAYTFTGFHLSEWGHVQLQTLGLLPLSAYFVVRFLDQRRWWLAVASGVSTGSTMLAAVYYGLIWLVVLGILLVGYVVARRLHPGPRFLRGVLVIGAVALTLMSPALVKYAEHAEERGYEEDLGLKARDLIMPAHGSYVWNAVFTFDGTPALQEHGLYPGVTVVGLGLLGGRRLARRRVPEVDDDLAQDRSPHARLHLTLLGVAGVTGLILAMGPTVLGLPMPFRLFHWLVPGFSGIRAYTRLAVPFLLALALLAGCGLAGLLGRCGRRQGLRLAVAAAAGALVLADLAAPLVYEEFPDGPQTLAVYHRLADLPPGPVVEIPMVDPGVLPADWAYVEAPRMVRSTLDFRPRVNGYSATAPETYRPDLATFNGFPTPESLQRAAELRVRYVVIHVGEATDHGALSEADAEARIAALPDGARAERHGDSWLIDLHGP